MERINRYISDLKKLKEDILCYTEKNNVFKAFKNLHINESPPACENVFEAFENLHIEESPPVCENVFEVRDNKPRKYDCIIPQ